MPKFFNKKTATVRFHGFNEEKKYQNSKSDIIVSKRLIELIAVTLVLIFILIIRLAYVQLTQADTLEVKLETYGSTTYTMMHRVEKSMIVIIQKSWVIKMLFVLIIMHLRKLQIKKLRILQNF